MPDVEIRPARPQAVAAAFAPVGQHRDAAAVWSSTRLATALETEAPIRRFRGGWWLVITT